MISKTKFLLTDEQIIILFEKAGIDGVTNIKPLGAGEFNAVYAVDGADGTPYAIKIAPTPETEVLSYEKNMLQAELYWYEQMQGTINIPKIYYSDFSMSIIQTGWFIMERLDGTTPDQLKITKEEKRKLYCEILSMCAKIHNKTNDKFGYIQGTLYDNWYDNIRALTVDLIESCKKKGHNSKRGEKLLKYIDLHKDILMQAECSMVNYDLWMPNFITKKIDKDIKIWWIDPERSFWGDKMSDFVCFDNFELSNKDRSWVLDAYNKVANTPVTMNKEEQVRYAIMLCYMGLIQETEKYYRYSIFNFGWIRNVISARFFFYNKGFKLLKKLS